MFKEFISDAIWVLAQVSSFQVYVWLEVLTWTLFGSSRPIAFDDAWTTSPVCCVVWQAWAWSCYRFWSRLSFLQSCQRCHSDVPPWRLQLANFGGRLRFMSFRARGMVNLLVISSNKRYVRGSFSQLIVGKEAVHPMSGFCIWEISLSC